MAAIREELILYDRFTKTFTQYIQLSKQAEGATNAVKKSTDMFESSQKKAASASSSLSGTIKRLAGAYLSLRSAQSIISLSDSIASTNARLNMMNDGLQTTKELQDMIYRSAMRSRASYTDMAATVAKLGNLAGNAFDSNAEIIAFAEQINKQMALSGTTTQEAQAAMLQLTQGLASGVLRGEELNSVLEQTPMIAQTIAKYMGVNTGEMRELASEGKITAEVVKNAMFAAADEADGTNDAFENLPKTWGQVWTQIKNIAMREFEPLLESISDFVNSESMEDIITGITLALRLLGSAISWVVDNLDILVPIIGIATAAWVGYKVAVWAANIATYAHPVGWIVAAIIALIGVLLWAWDKFEGFRTFWADLWEDNMNAYMDFYVAVLGGFNWLAKGMINIAADMTIKLLELMDGPFLWLKNWINQYNKIAEMRGGPQIPIDEIDTYDIERLRIAALAEVDKNTYTGSIDRDAISEAIEAQADQIKDFTFSGFIKDTIQKLRDEFEEDDGDDDDALNKYLEEAKQLLEDMNENVKSIEKTVNIADEDLKSLVDMAERQYVNNINLTAQTPVINITGQNTGHTAADRQNLANTIRDILIEQVASGSTRTTARAF